MCAALLTVASVSSTVPVAVADPAPSARPAEQGKDHDKKKKAEKVDTGQKAVDELLSTPAPNDVDGLIDRMSLISRTAGANNEEVEDLKVKIQGQDKAVAEAEKALAEARDKEKVASERAEASRAALSEVSRAAYRGSNVDPVTAVAGASGPAAAMDRSAYLSALSNDATARMDAVTRDIEEAQKAKSDAARAQAQNTFRLGELKSQHKKLDERTQTLEKLKQEVKATVDGFSPEQRQRWVDRNGPIDVDVDEFLGKLKESVPEASGDYAGAVAAAMSKLGAPYGWGATGPDVFDCSGLMVWAYQQVGKSIPRTSQAQLAGGQPVSIDALQPGDVIAYFPGATHVGMYIGDGKIVHASDYGIPVQVVPADSMPIAGAVRY